MISVLMPFRNQAAYVEAAARSILDQTVGDLELLAVDDGSTDEGPEILRSLGDPRLRVLENPGPRGPLAAQAHALELARFELVAFMDSDDVSAPQRLEWEMRELEDPAVALVGSLYGRMTPNGYLLDPPSPEVERERRTAADFTRGDRPWCDPSAMFRRADVLAVGFLDPDLGPMAPPTYLWYRLLEKGECVVVGRPLYYHRLRLGSLSQGAYGTQAAEIWSRVRAEYDPVTFETLDRDALSERPRARRRTRVTRAVEVYLLAGDLEAARRAAMAYARRRPLEPRAWKLVVKALLGRATLRPAAGAAPRWRPAGRWRGSRTGADGPQDGPVSST